LDAAMTTPPAGAQNGPNIRGANQPYMGPRTPAGPKHRYHLQVFALDTVLPADAGATYAALTTAMKDHVLASGEVIGLGQVAPAPSRGASPRAGPGRYIPIVPRRDWVITLRLDSPPPTALLFLGVFPPAPPAVAQTAPSIAVTGAVSQPLSLTAADLAA